MKIWKNWKLPFGILMVALSAAVYFIHFLLFRDLHHIMIYFVGDIAFVFIEVLLVSVIIHNLLNDWEKKSHLKKLNMVIETFFSEYGKPLLSFYAYHDKNLHRIVDLVTSIDDCPDKVNFAAAATEIKKHTQDIDIDRIELNKLRDLLRSKRGLLVNLLQNPNLLEHQLFSESLMALFHVTEELSARDLSQLSSGDLEHTKVDLERSYKYLTLQWLSYMDYTQKHYPYFFLYAMKTNPFDEKANWLERWRS
jgi:hypothetical protein